MTTQDVRTIVVIADRPPDDRLTTTQRMDWDGKPDPQGQWTATTQQSSEVTR